MVKCNVSTRFKTIFIKIIYAQLHSNVGITLGSYISEDSWWQMVETQFELAWQAGYVLMFLRAVHVTSGMAALRGWEGFGRHWNQGFE